MSKTAVIENDVPEPDSSNVRSYGVIIDINETVGKLKPGCSFVVDGETARKRAIRVGHRRNIKLTTRHIGDQRFRVWRKSE